jgi:hypothetical protein
MFYNIDTWKLLLLVFVYECIGIWLEKALVQILILFAIAENAIKFFKKNGTLASDSSLATLSASLALTRWRDIKKITVSRMTARQSDKRQRYEKTEGQKKDVVKKQRE